MNQLSNAIQYSGLWERESQSLESHDVYQKLAKAVPNERVLEIGCGVGNGTKHLADGREVLALDNNEHLIAKAAARLKDAGLTAQIHHCDLFELSDEDLKVITDFQPKVVVAWFIGSHGHDIFSRTPADFDASQRSKLYREHIEDIVASDKVTIGSVDIVNFAIRGGMATSFSAEEIFQAQKEDFDKYVFSDVGFEVYDVKVHLWDRSGSTFEYGNAPNPNFAGGETAQVITSILARRKAS
ncbi:MULTISPECIES: methyltransferase domain-containing protein [Pseudomonas]|uniref:methyltransferase domain-containing protein n=1 Tax=Pseudomonas TaxID=286 RepID=UPI000C88994C|nr:MULTISPECIES: methyltransferase domain-containing protein [Pseudomonas]PMY46455.1 class I SAM-dependent methyltransferase [Pseudomonas sp. FW306-2-2C-D06C]PYC35210.1 methyltransferase domain-containing protein [Pseudomonas chlororaphis]